MKIYKIPCSKKKSSQPYKQNKEGCDYVTFISLANNALVIVIANKWIINLY